MTMDEMTPSEQAEEDAFHLLQSLNHILRAAQAHPYAYWKELATWKECGDAAASIVQLLEKKVAA